MRFGIALLAACTLVSPVAAWARTAPPAETLLQTPFVLPESGVAIGEALRLRVLTVGAGRGRLYDDDSDLRMRLGGAMVDYYPIDGQGLRLSMGLRMFPRPNFIREAERRSGQRLSPPRGTPGIGSGTRRYTPAAMVGYSLSLGPDINLGFEGGAVAGRLDAVAPGLNGRGNPGEISLTPRSGINPVVRTALGMRF